MGPPTPLARPHERDVLANIVAAYVARGDVSSCVPDGEAARAALELRRLDDVWPPITVVALVQPPDVRGGHEVISVLMNDDNDDKGHFCYTFPNPAVARDDPGAAAEEVANSLAGRMPRERVRAGVLIALLNLKPAT